MEIYHNFAHELHSVASKSPIKYPVASILFRNKKAIDKPHSNTDRSSFHGAIHSSLHAEMNTLLHYFGNSLQWDRTRHMWRYQQKGKER